MRSVSNGASFAQWQGHDNAATELINGGAALGPVPVGPAVGGSLMSSVVIAAIKGLPSAIRAMAKRGTSRVPMNWCDCEMQVQILRNEMKMG